MNLKTLSYLFVAGNNTQQGREFSFFLSISYFVNALFLLINYLKKQKAFRFSYKTEMLFFMMKKYFFSFQKKKMETTNSFTMRAVAYVKNERNEKKDDFWGRIKTNIHLAEDLPTTAFDGISAFSHLEIIFYFHKANPQKVNKGSRHPRNNENWPKMGVFAQRNKSRPNLIGTTIVKLLKHDGRTLVVEGLDAINDTPILDIKPIFKEFLPNSPILQADWSVALMQDYFR